MRNGNLFPFELFLQLHYGSYRTYEEWKPTSTGDDLGSTVKVLTVPMRNGNGSRYLHCSIRKKFLPYL